MRKATGKVVSLVLALALVVTSFSSTFAFAATKSESAASVSAKDGTVYLANLSNVADNATALERAKKNGQNLFNITDYVTGAELETYDHIAVEDVEISSVSVSGDNIIRVTKVTESNRDSYVNADVGDYVATVRDVKGTGTATVNVLYTGKTTDRGEDEVTVRGSKSFKVVLLDAMTPVMMPGEEAWGDSINGLQKNPQYFDSNYKYDAVNDPDHEKPITFDFANVVLPRTGNNTAEVSKDNSANRVTGLKLIQANDEKQYGPVHDNQLKTTFIVSATGTNNYLEVLDSGFTYGIAKPSVGNSIRLNIYSVKSVDDGKNIATNKIVTQSTAKVENRVSGTITNVDLGDGSQAMVGINGIAGKESVLSKSKAYAEIDDIVWDVTGANIESDTAIDISGGKLGNVKADDDVTVSGGTIGNVEGANVNLYGGSVNEVKTAGHVDISNATASSIKEARTVTIQEGKVTGDVTATDYVELAPLNEEVEVSVGGTVTTQKLTVDGTVGKASVGAYFADESDGYTESALTLEGSNAVVNKIDVDYRNTTVSLNNFQGTIPAIVNGNYTGYSETGAVLKSENTDDSYDATRATVNGNMNIYTIELNSGAVTFNGNVSVNNVYGSDADFIINAGGLRVVDSVATSNILKIANAADVIPGTVVYSATSDIADENSFVGYGFTLKTVAGTSSDSFVIDGVSFAGLAMDKTNVDLLVGESVTLTASAYPNGTALPENTKIRFFLDGDENYISGTDNGNGTAVVTANKYNADFSVLNKATVTAVVYDEFDIELEEYGNAVCQINVIEKPKTTYTSDTTGDVYVQAGNTYQFKITSLDGKVPNFGIGSPSFKLVASSNEGNDYFFKVQAVGNIGDACGIYINSDPNKVAVMHVVADYTCDTTTVNVPVGGSYQVKITANARPTVAAGNSIYTVEYVSNSGNDYFFKITATQNAKAGDVVGFYVNGGPRAFVATTV